MEATRVFVAAIHIFFGKSKLFVETPNFPKLLLETPNFLNFLLETPNFQRFLLETPNFQRFPLETPNFPFETPNSPWKPKFFPEFFIGNPKLFVELEESYVKLS